LTQFFIKLKLIKYKIFTKIKYLIFILKFSGKNHFTKSFLIKNILVNIHTNKNFGLKLVRDNIVVFWKKKTKHEYVIKSN